MTTAQQCELPGHRVRRPLRVAYLNAWYKAGLSDGGFAHVNQFIRNATALGHQVWTAAANEHPQRHPMPTARLALGRVMRSMDVVYVRLEWSMPRAARLASGIYRHLLGSRPMVWEFNTVPEYGRLLGHSREEVDAAVRAYRRHAQDCDLAVCVSSALATYVTKQLGIRRALVVPNGSDPELFRPDLVPSRRAQRRPHGLNVLWMGSAHLAWNDFEMLRGAAEALWEKHRDDRVCFHVLGGGFEGTVARMPPNVHYHGRESYEALPQWLAGMDVGLCLYRSGPADYGSPLKLFDYMSSGLTVVATAHPQVREVFHELGQPDLMLEQGDARGLARVLEDLATRRDRLRHQGAAGRELVVRKYNWRRAVEDTFDAIEDLLQARER